MKKRISLALAALIFVLMIPGAFAAPTGGVFNEGQLLSGSEQEALRLLAEDAAAQTGFSFVILLLNEPVNGRYETYCDSYFRSVAPGQAGVMLSVNLHSRDVYVSCYEDALDYFSQKRLDSIRSEITPSLTGGRYADACRLFIELTESRLRESPTWFSRRMSDLNTPFFFTLCGAVLVAGVLILWGLTTRGIHTKPPASAMYTSNVRMVRQSDIFLRTHTTKTPISTNNGGGSHGGGGGGRSRGSSGKF